MTAAGEYARALYAIASDEGMTDAFLDELSTVDSVLIENPSYIKLLDTPALKKEEKLRLIDSAFASLNEYVVNMLKLLCEARSVGLLSDIFAEYGELYDIDHNITRVTAITAVPMSEEQKALLKCKLEGELKCEAILSCEVDRAILGGIILRYAGTQTDASVRARLDAISANIKNVIV